MSNLITRYQEFLFEADSTETQIGAIRLEISKLQDQLKVAKNKMLDDKKKATGEIQQLKAESDYLSVESQIFGKMIPLTNELKTKLDQRSAELKG